MQKPYRWIQGNPISEPLTLNAVKSWLKTFPNDTSEDTDVIQPIISAAREYCENITGTAYATESIAAYYDQSSDGKYILPRLPASSITSVTVNGAETEDYTADTVRGVVTVPSLLAGADIVITYSTGSVTVPFAVRQAMLCLIGHWYENREAVVESTVSNEVEMTVKALLSQYKEWWF